MIDATSTLTLAEANAVLPQAPAPAPPLPPDAARILQDVAQGLQDAAGRAAVQAEAAPAVAGTQASQATIDALRGMIAAETARIEQLTGQLVPGMTNASVRAITNQIEQSQERLSSLQAQLDRALGTSNVTEFTAQQAPPFPVNFGPQADIPPGVMGVAIAFFVSIAVVAIGLPLARAFARRMDRKSAGAPAPSLPASLEPRLDRIEQAIEAIAIEVERVSEGQRYTNKVMSEVRALPSPNPLEQWPPAGAKEAVPAERKGDR